MKAFTSLQRVALTSAVLAATISARPVFAMQTTQEAPVSQPAANDTNDIPEGEHLTVTVASVEGKVQYSTDDEKTWKPCTQGLVLGEGASFRTGIRSSVTFTLPPNQTITLDRLGTVKVLQAVKQRQSYKTDVGMKYGRTHYEVQAAGIEHESTVRTPNSTLAVRGTDVTVNDQRPFPPEAIHNEGIAEWTSGKRKQLLANGKSTAVGGEAAAETALLQSVVDPSIVFARTQSEVPLVANLLSRGAVFQAGNSKNIPIVRGGVPPTDKQVLALLPGRLNFVLRWDGPANLDLLVGAVPAASSNFNGNASSANVGEALYPATGANFSASGGTIPFDHQGGKHGGFEIAYWPKNLPADLFAIGVNHTSGATVNYSLDVYLGRTPLLILDPAANGGLGAAVTHLTERIGAGQSGGGITVTRGPLPFPTLPGDLPPVISAAKAFPAAQVTKTPTRTVPAGELRMGSGVLKTQK